MAVLSLLIPGLMLGGCDGLLEVDVPGLVKPDDLLTPENAHFLVSGSIADFECALGAYIVNSGLLGNELTDATVTAARFSLDRRDLVPSDGYGPNACTGNPPGIYTPLSTARWSADNAIAQLGNFTDAEVANRVRLIGQAAAYSGYSHVLMGEGFCTVVIEEDGPELQPADAFQAAVARFTLAIEQAQSAGDIETVNLARLGRARAHLNLGNLNDAAIDARAVLANNPTFAKLATASGATGRRFNRVGDEFFGGRSTVSEAYRALTVDGQPDPRVGVLNTQTPGADQVSQIWIATKIGPERTASLRDAGIPIATWREAHLIIAEAEGGQEAVTRINILRANAELPNFAGGTAEQIRQQIIEERKRELFLEGHHLNDLQRFTIDLAPAEGASYRQGGTYGDRRCFPLPDVERNNNPNVS